VGGLGGESLGGLVPPSVYALFLPSSLASSPTSTPPPLHTNHNPQNSQHTTHKIPPPHTHKQTTKQRLYAKLRAALKAPDARLDFDGQLIQEGDTPQDLDMEDEDLIDVKGV
jgi:hypothetical protein